MKEDLAECCRQLKLGRNIVDMAEKVQASSHIEFLITLFRTEITHREEKRKEKLLKKANFYCLKNFDTFCFDEVTLPTAVTPEYLKNCEFLETKTNIVMYGNVGTGKTFLSMALGAEACKRGHETRFFRTAALVNQLSEEKRTGNLSRFMKQIEKADLLICDEWGYVPLDRTGAQLLFEIVSECYERKSLILTTNIEFSKWVNVFYDEKMTGAIIDRLLHHCHLIVFPGPSNRIRESGIDN
jgi:DNA replication protein DnaC